jgi:hypothetical protein
MSRHPVKDIAPVLRVEPWADPVVEAVGHDPRSAYAHEFWLPIVGPSGLLVTRKLLERLEAAGGPCDVDTVELASSVGLGPGAGRNSRITATLGRLAGFGLLHVGPAHDGTSAIVLRTAWAPLTRSQALKLPPALLERLAAA